MTDTETQKAKEQLNRLKINAKPWALLSGYQKKDRIVNLLAHVVLVTGIPFLPIFLAFVQGYTVDEQSILLTVSIFILTVALAADELIFLY